MKKKLIILFWIVVIVSIIVVLKLVNDKFKNQQLSEVIIEIDLNDTDELITEKDIEDLIYQGRDSIMSQKVGDIDLQAIETIVKNNPYVLDANAFINVDASLIIKAKQKKPILRVFNTKGQSYYVDENGSMMPLHALKSITVVVANNKITQAYNPTIKLRTFDSIVPENIKDITLLEKIFHIATVIHEDSMLSDLIGQIYVSDSAKFELTPVIGEQNIILGDIYETKNKLKKLKYFYKQAYRMHDFAKYETFDLRFENQIVCTKKENL